MKCSKCGKEFADYTFAITGMCAECNLEQVWNVMNQANIPLCVYGERKIMTPVERVQVLVMDRNYADQLASTRSSSVSDRLDAICDSISMRKKDGDRILSPLERVEEMVARIKWLKDQIYTHNVQESVINDILDSNNIPKSLPGYGCDIDLPLASRVQMLANLYGQRLSELIDIKRSKQ